MGGAATLAALAVQQLEERKRARSLARDSRLNELVDRLQHDRQFVRASAVVGITDLATSLSKKDSGANQLFNRCLSQLSVMLHTEEDGAVQRVLRPSFSRLAKEVIQNRPDLATTLVDSVTEACDCSYRWLVSAAAYGVASCGQQKMIQAKEILADRSQLFFELEPEVIGRAFDEANRIGQRRWEEFVFENDAGKKEDAHPGRFLGSTLGRYSLCVRTLRDVGRICNTPEEGRAGAHLKSLLWQVGGPDKTASTLNVDIE
ncbi:MAG: hypothetical protein QOJ65_973 [Fimbriimonadaceae bacterium]|nr:hypothetical protein [Fimbriimonadaceae bacterium]